MNTLQWHHERLSEKKKKTQQTEGAFLREGLLENLFQIHVTVEDLEQNNKMNFCKLPKLNEKDSLVLKGHTSKVTKLLVLMCNPF